MSDGMHLPVGSVTCGENFGSVGTSCLAQEGSLVAGLQQPSLNPRYQQQQHYPQQHRYPDASEDVAEGGAPADMSESAAVGELWWTERLVGEAQAEHPGELVRTGTHYTLNHNDCGFLIFSWTFVFFEGFTNCKIQIKFVIFFLKYHHLNLV